MRILLPWFLLLSGCLSWPELRVGQAKAPPPVTVTAKQREAWAQAADFLDVVVTEPPEADAVARALSQGIGAPVTQATSHGEILEDLQKEGQNERKREAAVNQFLTKHEGRVIEGTGWNLAGPLGGLGIVGLIVLSVILPGFATAAIWVARRAYTTTKGALGAVVKSVEDYQREKPEEAQALLKELSKRMDSSHKLLVAKLKQST